MQSSHITKHQDTAIHSVFSPKWYIEQLKGWTFASYMLLMFGIGAIIGTTIVNPINLWTFLPMVAGILGFTCTISITNVRPLNGVFGIISALIYIIVAYHVTNYADVILQLSYILLLDLPVLLLPSWAQNVGTKVRQLKDSKISWTFLTVGFFILAFVALFYLDTHILISKRPLIDSIAGTIGLTGALLATLRFSDQYYFWILQGAMSVILWGITAVQGDATLTLFFTYILYLANDAISIFDTHIAWFHKDNYLKEHMHK
jgi:nicotinamide mononucleotide transporter